MAIEAAAVPFDALDDAAAAVVDLVGERRIVLLGEASHGTHEFYAIRAAATRRLIEAGRVDAVAVEADWPDAYRVNCHVRGAGEDAGAAEALADFRRFPAWMWRNTDVAAFVDRLRAHNASAAAPVGFYGMDLYSLRSSIEAVLQHLARVDPDAAARARDRYACFEHVGGGDPASYGAAATYGEDSCEEEAVAQLVELQERAAERAVADGRVPADAEFFAEQNARLVRNAERYYRAMYRGRHESWNVRDRHMVETLGALADRIERDAGRPARIVVWAHNSHLGDARATEMGEHGEVNVGQLVRERWGEEAALVGFSTHTGTVRAAADWGAAGQVMRVRPSMDGSYEQLFAHARPERFVLELAAVHDELCSPRLERAIGVVYRPETERRSHYFHARLPEQFDAVVHLDETTAVTPL